MKIEVLYVDHCAHYSQCLSQLKELLRREEVDADLHMVPVASEEEAQRQRFLGSPTVRVNGVDVEPGAASRTDFGVQCRLYQDSADFRGTPPEEWIISAIRRSCLFHT